MGALQKMQYTCTRRSGSFRLHSASAAKRRMSDTPLPATGSPVLLRAMGMMVVSTLCFVSMHAVVSRITQELHPYEAAFFRNLFGFVVLLPMLARARFSSFRTTRLGLHSVRGVLNGASMLMFFTGISITPLAQVTALSYAAPLFATLLAALVLRETIRARRITALAIGFIGTLIVLRPGFHEMGLGPLLVLGSTLLWAVVLIDIKILSRTDSTLTITSYMLVFVTPVTFVAALFYWQWPTWEQLIWLFALGLLGSAGQLLFTEALKMAETSVLMPLDFLKMVWATLIGYFAFAQMPDLWTWVGGALIFASATYISYREHQLAREAKGIRPPVK